jgi:hypothetical protein
MDTVPTYMGRRPLLSVLGLERPTRGQQWHKEQLNKVRPKVQRSRGTVIGYSEIGMAAMLFVLEESGLRVV